jgi:hypothetical protein
VQQAGVSELLEELHGASQRAVAKRDPELDRRVLLLRHRAGLAMVAEAGDPLPVPEPASERLPERPGRELPDFGPADLDAGLLRAAILRDGCMLIRGLLDRGQALDLANGIESAFAARAARAAGEAPSDGYYEELVAEGADPPIENQRPWIESGGGVLAADSPRLAREMFDAMESAGLRDLITAYLGEHPAVSAQKCTLRKAEPTVIGAWHQDGAFMGDVRSLHVWVALSHCGDEAPGLDLVPRRLDELVPTGGEGTMIADQVSQATAERAAGEIGILRPIFEPGDVMLFDDLFIHKTASGPAMSKPRYAIESWFFGPSAFPPRYVPLAF